MMRILVLVALCAFGSSHPIDDIEKRDAGGCEAGWTYINSYCYFPAAMQTSWENAASQCDQRGGVLAVVKSDQQGTDVLETQKNTGHFAYWIGAKGATDGELKFTDKIPSTYRNWAKEGAKPTAGKQCVRAYKIAFGSPLASWEADSCDGQYPFTCQKRAAELAGVTLTYKTPLPNTAGITMVCNIDFPTGLDATFDVEWYANGALVKTDRVQGADVRESHLKAGHSWEPSENEFKAGDTLQCKVKACLGSTCTPTGTQKSSNDYFVGMKVEPENYFELDECSQKSIKVTLVPTVPIRCTNDALSNCNDFETEYGVSVPISHDSKVKVSDCSADFEQNEDPDKSKVDVEIVPVCDNINGNGDEFKVTFEKIMTTHPFWKGYQPEPVTIKITDKNTPIRQCYCNDDPHCKTLGGRAYDYMGSGTYVMYRNNYGNYEVQIKTKPCNGRASCTCAGVVRFGGVSVVMDSCSGFMNYYLRPNGATLPKGMHVQRNCGGNNCRMIVTTPNGNTVRFNKNGRWHQFYVDAHMEPGSCKTEGEGKRCGGLCGNVNSGADFYTRNGQFTSNPNTFGESWRINPDDSYFQKNPEPIPEKPGGGNHPLPEKTCNCNVNPPDCEYNFNDIFDPLNEGAEDINEELEQGNNRRRRAVSSLLRAYVRQTRSTISRQEASNMCDKAIFQSAVGKACVSLNGFQKRMNTMKDNCIFDIQASEDPTVVAASVNTLIESCLFEAVADPANRVNGKPPTAILDNICEADCSGHGTCNKGKCTCDADYTSQDCSISMKEAPVLDKSKTSPVLCDKKKSGCKVHTVLGSGFLNSNDLTCHLEENILVGSGSPKKEKTTGKQIGVFQVRCKMPVVTTPSLIKIAVSNNGALKSTDSAQFIIFNSDCQNCDANTGKCTVKDNKCSINGKCYIAGTKNPQNDKEECKPDSSQSSWTGDSYKSIGCFADKKRDRAFKEVLGHLRQDINWKKMSLTVKECARLAKVGNRKYFAIQFYGECYSDEDAKAAKNYDKYGESTNFFSGTDTLGTEFAVGRDLVNCVYKYD